MKNSKNHPFFKHFTKSETDLILNHCKSFSFKSNEIIFKENSSKFCGAIIVKTGNIEIYNNLSDKPLDGFVEGDYFNIPSLKFAKKELLLQLQKMILK